MPVILVGLVILLLSMTSMQYVAAARAELEASERAAEAMSFHTYARHVDTYVREHPQSRGEIRSADLALPTWYIPRTSFRNHVADGIGFTYIRRADAANLEAKLAGLTPTCPQCGIKKASSVIALDERVIGPAPSAIPEGSLVRRR